MKKIAIVCGSPSSEFMAPFEDEEWEIWVLGNRLNRFDGKRVTRVFEIHDDLSEHGDPLKYAQWLAVQHNYPLIVGENFPISGENVSVFPFKEAEELFGSTYLTSSPAYMMAMAILEGATHIGIYGVDLSADDHEYFWQRPCMEAWIGFAKGRGIEVSIPEVSSIGKCSYVEGRNSGGKPDFEKPPFTEKAFLEMAGLHQKKMDSLYKEIEERNRLINTHDGCRQAYERLAKTARAVESGMDNITLSGTVSMK